ncbi:MAG TPA: hypothetical protein VEL11_18990 [Candidatus Bathyarchaeia archaeon]|nr:hypothetical protein [Candidatus Bathyarchaeia archaeon]
MAEFSDESTFKAPLVFMPSCKDLVNLWEYLIRMLEGNSGGMFTL